MSLIYQALRQLHNDAETHDGEAPPAASVSSSAPETPSAPSGRKWWVIALTLVLVLAGLGAVWGTRHLTDRLQTNGAPFAAAARDAVPVPSSPAVQSVPQAPSPTVAPVADATYFPPDASPAGAPSPIKVPGSASADAPHAAPMSFTAAIGTENNDSPSSQGVDQSGALPDQAEAVPGMPTTATVTATAEDGFDERPAAASAPAVATEGRPEHDSAVSATATAGSPPAGDERAARPDRSPPQWSAEQARLEHARRTARERSSRIHRLVADLETAVALNPDDNGTIRALLDQLAQAQGADDPYVVKMHAYWRFRRGDLDAARTLFQQVADADESDLEAGINLALIEARSGERGQALARLNQLRRAHPDNLQVAELLRRLN
ncbi:tetratricopeptide repeat protein [Desulfatitalea alkaliphila]|uniref:Tetratricopeptide repeat protein n=1 Tax=Desulfatitalea alkaliphila TaxID=2929485 RepID=A0AA41R308_9BACT|nr:tetratricopeptide repeat protein [Desulfatitalea alkaliphila]MCJ8502142.1 tetratricopeptide repeat protein [Desulfatitalea alkaliphila]